MIRIFALLGPGIGATIGSIVILHDNWGRISDLVAFSVLYTFVLGYLIGIVPAICSGFIYSRVISLSKKNDIGFHVAAAVASAVTGFLVVTLGFLILFGEALGLVGLAAILSALICSIICSIGVWK